MQFCIELPKTEDIVDILPKNGIFVFNNFISEQTCDKLVSDINKRTLHEEINLNPNTNVKALRLGVREELNLPAHEYVMKKIKDFGRIMSEKYAIANTLFTEIQYRKIYGPTKIHSDASGVENNAYNQSIVRTLSVIIALNDDYEGGELVFPLQNYEIKLKKGQLIAFPPYWTHPHYTNNLQNGTFRYTINFWYGT